MEKLANGRENIPLAPYEPLFWSPKTTLVKVLLN